MSLLFAKVVNNFSYELRCFNILIVHVQYFKEMLQLIFFQVNFIFPLYQTHHTLPYPETKEKKNFPGKKINCNRNNTFKKK